MRRLLRLGASFLAALLGGGIGVAVAQGEADALADIFDRGGWVDSGAAIVTGPLAEAVDRVGTRACFRIGGDASPGGAGRCRCVARIGGRAQGPQGKVLSLEFGEEHECGQRPPGRQDAASALQELVGRYPLRVVRETGGCSGAEIEGSFSVTSATENAIALSINGTPVRAAFNWQDRSFRTRLSQEGTNVDLSGRFTRQARSVELDMEMGINLAGRCTITFAGSKPAPEQAAPPPAAPAQPAQPAQPAAAPASAPPPPDDEPGPIAEGINDVLDWLDSLEGMIAVFVMSLSLGAGAAMATRPKAPKADEEAARLRTSARMVRRLAQQIRNGPVVIREDQWETIRALGKQHGAHINQWFVYEEEWGMDALANDLDALAKKIDARVAGL